MLEAVSALLQKYIGAGNRKAITRSQGVMIWTVWKLKLVIAKIVLETVSCVTRSSWRCEMPEVRQQCPYIAISFIAPKMSVLSLQHHEPKLLGRVMDMGVQILVAEWFVGKVSEELYVTHQYLHIPKEPQKPRWLVRQSSAFNVKINSDLLTFR